MKNVNINTTSVLIPILSALLLIGCYESEVPLSPVEDAELDFRLQGRWRIVDQTDPEADDFILAIPFDRHAFYIEYCCDEDESMMGTDEIDTLRFRMFTTYIDGIPFANLQPLAITEDDNEEPDYWLLRYNFSPNGDLTFRTIGQDLFEIEFQSSEALYEFVRQNMDNEKLYMDDEAFFFRKVE